IALPEFEHLGCSRWKQNGHPGHDGPYATHNFHSWNAKHLDPDRQGIACGLEPPQKKLHYPAP
ncbi:MAG: hypothetical protein CMP29_06860, partial [Roseibacillus sp.]|nr:hypothetical protein [Roseibacillus sp.]